VSSPSSRDSPARSARLSLLSRLSSLAVVVFAATPVYCLPLLQDTFDGFDIRSRPAGLNTMSWEVQSGEVVRDFLDGPALGLMTGARVISVQRVDSDDYTYLCEVSCLNNTPGRLIFAYQDEKTYWYAGISGYSRETDKLGHLVCVVDGVEEKVGESKLLPVPTGGRVQAVYKVHLKNDGAKFLIEIDRDGLANGKDYELSVEVTKKEVVERFHGGRVGIAECYTGGRPRVKPWLVYDSVRIESGKVEDTTVRQAVTLFVDGATGKDENPGTKEQPVKTIAKALAYSLPADEVVVMPGEYSVKITFPQTKTYGTVDKKLTIRALEPHKARVPGIDGKNADFVTIDGFQVVGGGISIIGQGCEVRNCYIHDVSGKAGISVQGENNLVISNHIQRVNTGVQVNGRNNRVEGNDIEQLVLVTGSCDYIQFIGEGHVLKGNYLHGTRNEDLGTGGSLNGFHTMAIRQDDYAKDILIDGNLLTGPFTCGVDCEGKANWGGRPTSAESITLRNNVFAGGAKFVSAQRVRNLAVLNNTFINPGVALGGIGLEPTRDATRTTGTVKNNILYNCFPLRFLTKDAGVGAGTEMTGNLIFTAGEGAFLEEGWPGNVVNKDPMLVDASNILGADGKPFTADDGYFLKPGSPCVDAAGIMLDVSSAHDIMGTVRPQGRGWDIGAYEAVVGGRGQ